MPSLPLINSEVLAVPGTDGAVKRAIGQFPRSPVLHKRHGPAWQAKHNRHHSKSSHHHSSGGHGNRKSDDDKNDSKDDEKNSKDDEKDNKDDEKDNKDDEKDNKDDEKDNKDDEKDNKDDEKDNKDDEKDNKDDEKDSKHSDGEDSDKKHSGSEQHGSESSEQKGDKDKSKDSGNKKDQGDSSSDNKHVGNSDDNAGTSTPHGDKDSGKGGSTSTDDPAKGVSGGGGKTGDSQADEGKSPRGGSEGSGKTGDSQADEGSGETGDSQADEDKSPRGGDKSGSDSRVPNHGEDTQTSHPTDPTSGNGQPNNSGKAKDALAPSADANTIPGTPFFSNAGSSMVPLNPAGAGQVNSDLAPPSLPSSTAPTDDKSFGPKVIAYTLIPLTVLVGLAYGVIAYRRRINRRRLRRRVEEDAEAAAAAAAAMPPRDDDTASIMSEVSYRPPAPFTSEVDITTESMENNPDIVAGSDVPHLISAPKRNEARTGDYQDYSHVCQNQMMGKKCNNHSISCFVALNHSSGGLNAVAAARSASGPNATAGPALAPVTNKIETDSVDPL